MLTKSEVARYLEDCKLDPIAIDEVLGAYVLTKFMRGYTCDRVMAKLRMLVEHLKSTHRQEILEVAGQAFRVIGHEVTQGGGHIGASPATTITGKRVWNLVRRRISYTGSPSSSTSSSSTSSLASVDSTRPSKKLVLTTDEIYGGPGSVASFIALHQKTTVNKHIGSMLGIGLGLEGPSARPMRRRSPSDPMNPTASEDALIQSRERMAGQHFRTRPHLVAVLPGYESDTPAYYSDDGALPVYDGRADGGHQDADNEDGTDMAEGDSEFWGETIRADEIGRVVEISA